MTFTQTSIKTVRSMQVPLVSSSNDGGLQPQTKGLRAQWIQENDRLICRWIR